MIIFNLFLKFKNNKFFSHLSFNSNEDFRKFFEFQLKLKSLITKNKILFIIIYLLEKNLLCFSAILIVQQINNIMSHAYLCKN